MPRYKLTIEYDGTGLAGWQRQPDQPSVQEHVESAIERMLGEKARIFCAGRTDAGVHALGQVAHVDLEKQLKPFNLQQGINFQLHQTHISILRAEEVDSEFHARFSATRRRYTYRIINRSAKLSIDNHRAWHVPHQLDAKLMHEAAQLLVGHHDFTSFRDTQCQSASPVKTLEQLDVEQLGQELRIHGMSRSFLHHQMRNMVGSLVLVGRGKWTKVDLQHALDAKDRRSGGPTAPPEGLYLVEVSY